jgi:O-acetyl-ADP-ribose deacetylase (regulator of RNase III)
MDRENVTETTETKLKLKIKNTVISIIQGDITEMETDALVNAANNHLWMGGGVAGALKRSGGQVIENEAKNKGPIEIGEAVVTTAGALNAKYVIHAAGMGMDLRTDATKIQNATTNSLKRAHELELRSIAFPSIGTGVGGFPLKDAARIMLGSTVKFLSEFEDTTLEKIIFVLFDANASSIFVDELEKLS